MKKIKSKLILLFLIIIHLNSYGQNSVDFRTGELCPNIADGHLVAGDRHFDGEVDMELTLTLKINEQRNKILLDVNLIEQAVSRTTRIEADWKDILVYESPTNKFISSYSWDCGYRNFNQQRVYRNCNIDKLYKFTYKERLPESGGEAKPFNYNDGKAKSFAGGRNSPIKYFRIVADTGTEDISDDRDCGHDGKIIDIVLEQLEVNLSEGRDIPFDIDNENLTGRIKTHLFEELGTNPNEIIQYIHTEYGTPELIKNVNKNWWSALWKFEKVSNTPFYRLKCKFNDNYLIVRDRKLQLRQQITEDSWNAMWLIETTKNPEYYRFKNRLSRSYIYYEGSSLLLKINPENWFNATWEIENVKF